MEEAKGTGAPKEESQTEILERMIAEHKAQEEDERLTEVDPFSLINKGSVRINSIEEADAIAKLLVEADRRLASVKAIEAKRVAREESRATRLHGIFEGALEAWTKAQLVGKKRRSLLLKHAELRLRRKPAHNHTFSEAELAAWAEREFVDAVTYKSVVSLERVKEWETKNGKPAPGRIHVDEEEGFKLAIPNAKEESDVNQA